MKKKRKPKKMRKNENFLLKGIITKSDQKDAGATFVRIRNSHEGNVPFSQKRKMNKKKKKLLKNGKKEKE